MTGTPTGASRSLALPLSTGESDGYVPIDTRNCSCWPDYSTPDAPSLDENPDCPAHAARIAERDRLAALHPWTGEDPF